ncbi:HesA/MoeB/ThiF family protein [Roseibium sp. AS2]|uniref:HesA/MoeB/ThiF family protein n=1 Tax=Roseibium sp. AS2 TaxID=3135781 RepID=UPI00317D6654
METKLTQEENRHYVRQMIVPGWGEAGQLRLKQSRILVIGAGGLGAPVLLYLAAAGVGAIGIADGDYVEGSNLHRQVIHGIEDLDRPKVASAAEKLRRSNPHVLVTEHTFPVHAGNADSLIAQYDLVVDCTDNFTTRETIALTCRKAKIPLVSGAAQITDGTITTFTPYKGAGHPCFNCLYPRSPGSDLTPGCSQIGVAGPVLAVIGGLQAMEAVKEIIGMGDSLSGRVLVYDALSARTEEIALERRGACPCASACEEERRAVNS